jgi:hypothetical protein
VPRPRHRRLRRGWANPRTTDATGDASDQCATAGADDHYDQVLAQHGENVVDDLNQIECANITTIRSAAMTSECSMASRMPPARAIVRRVSPSMLAACRVAQSRSSCHDRSIHPDIFTHP